MATQLEDCVDALKVMLPHFDFVLLFDHSSGHARKRVNGLDAGKMQKGFGGQQPWMRPTLIKENEAISAHTTTQTMQIWSNRGKSKR